MARGATAQRRELRRVVVALVLAFVMVALVACKRRATSGDGATVDGAGAAVPVVPADVELASAARVDPLEPSPVVVVVAKSGLRVGRDGPTLAPIPSDMSQGLDAKYKGSERQEDLLIAPLARAIPGDVARARGALVVIDAAIGYRVVAEVLHTLDASGAARLCVAVTRTDEARASEPACLHLAQPDPCLAAQRASPEQRTHEQATARWLSSLARHGAFADDAEALRPLTRCDGAQEIAIAISREGYAIAIGDTLDGGRNVAPGCADLGPGVAAVKGRSDGDFDLLRQCIARLKDARGGLVGKPFTFTIQGSSETSMREVVRTIDALARPDALGAPLVPEITLGGRGLR